MDFEGRFRPPDEVKMKKTKPSQREGFVFLRRRPPLRLCENLKHPPQHHRSYPRASLRELESNKFCRHQAVYSPAGTARNVVSSRRGDSKGGHIGVSPFGVFFFCHFFLHKQKEMARDLSGIYNHRHCEPVRTPVWRSVFPSGGHILFAQSKRIWKEKAAKGGCT